MNHRHFKFHKPYNCLSQFIYEGKRKASKHLLGEYYDYPQGTMAIGRLDENSEGLLLLTTNGKVSEAIRSKKVEKEYYVQVQGEITEDAITQLAGGIEIGVNGMKYLTLPCKVMKINYPNHLPLENRRIHNEDHGPSSWISITLREGKFRQVRKMTYAMGFPTLRLVRYRVDDICLDLPVRSVQELFNL
ncbi:MAG: pseudouridine synthase [Chitinophagales bacterium]|jgi:23S rRNA pseudouridine2457 synthase|tara:strand:- start:29545 stop:30111 length:567 start_codon:yes stop_codon:yes gene_type:complete